MAKIIQNLEELPYENRKIYNLVIEQSSGNVKAFSELIGVSQQVLDRLFRKDKRTDKYPSVSPNIKESIKNKFNVGDAWFIKEDEESDLFPINKDTPSSYEMPTINEMIKVISLLSEQGK